MREFDDSKAPFPWFGGKSKAAPLVWAALGDVEHYVEPFAGSLAVLLKRPHEPNRVYYSETVNDLDGMLCNFWRSVQIHPDATADAASWPVSEADLHARHLRLVRWRAEQPLERLMADPEWCDPVMAGWWAWGISCWIGAGWCAGTGAWIEREGLFVRQERAPVREPGVARQLPHLGSDGKGVNRPQLREPGCGDEPEFHTMTMPKLRAWLAYLSARLRHVRVLHGDWKRACTHGALNTLFVRGKGFAGVFLDPPYSTDVRTDDLYACDSSDVSAIVRQWCAENGENPRYRIVLAGFVGEGHEVLVRKHGWREVEWFKAGWLSGGMANTNADAARKGSESQKQERLWLSPHCVVESTQSNQGSLF
jgi:hypothetical protein